MPDLAAVALPIELESDLQSDGSFGRRTLRITADSVIVREPGGAESLRIPISDIKAARNEPVVGGGRLEITTHSGEKISAISYTQTEAVRFSEAARGIEQLAKGEDFTAIIKAELLRCPKCNRLLPERDGICPSCVNRGKTLARIASYLKPYKLQASLLVLCAMCGTALNLAPPYLSGRIVDEVLEPRKNLPILWQLLTIWIVVLAGSVVVEISRGRLVSFLAGNVAADLRSSVYRAVEFLQVAFFDKKQVGAIASRVTHDTDRVWGFLVDGVPFFVINGMLMIGVVTFITLISPAMALAVVAPIPIIVGISVLFWKPMSQMFHRVGQKWARFHMHLNESLNGIRVVKVFAKEDKEYRKFMDRNHELRDAGVRADSRWYTIFGAMTLFTASGRLIAWSVGGTMVVQGKMTLGSFFQCILYLDLLYGPLYWFAQVNNWFSRAMAGAERIFEIIDMDKERYAAEGLKPAIQGGVEFRDVRFGYDKSNPVLRDFNLLVKPGEMIGLVGKSGSGKSTTINLICRFYEADSGSILIDGVDTREMNLQHMREQIGVVLQEPFLFHGTIADNIAYGKPGAPLEEIIEAARAANAHNFIMGKPDAYDTVVGERGAKLSGGEKQRISIARAILHNPKILILDEATSSVDVETEKQIQEAIQVLVKGRTTFAIAHRLSTLRNADRLVVLEKGRIVEVGTHDELMKAEGAFYQLVKTQSAIQEIVGLAYLEGDEELPLPL